MKFMIEYKIRTAGLNHDQSLAKGPRENYLSGSGWTV
jgi:hypothetical protein